MFVGLLNILSNLITAQDYTENCVDSICVAAYECGLHSCACDSEVGLQGPP